FSFLSLQQSTQHLNLQPWAGDGPSIREEAHRFLSYITTLQLQCGKAKVPEAGSQEEASTAESWSVCLDNRFTSPLRLAEGRCLVYSFSLDKRSSEFDLKMAEMGCEVHRFGPSSKRPLGLLPGGPMHYHRLWLDWCDRGPAVSSRKSQRSTQKLSQIMKHLGHRRIDILKADLESAEWKVLESMLLESSVDQVTQLIITIHVHWPGFEVSGSDVEVARFWYSLLKELETRGFRLFHTYKHPNKPQVFLHKQLFNASSSYTLCWVNIGWIQGTK
uniref:Methyltransferase domain-containing protein n=2 Tax=Latimeria chalumnae TaxID=7897 RepID=H3B972_LATCH